jgi:hypothetical protein
MLKALRVGSAQAIRSITLILLPISFISLVVWATAGSSSGNTADPLRAALWFFLVAHQVPLQLSLSDATISGSLTYLPLGALAIPYLAARSGYLRMVEALGEPNSRQKRDYIFGFAIPYSIIGYLISLLALGKTVKVPYFVGIPIIFLVVTISAFIVSGILPKHEVQFPWQRALRVAVIVLALILGIAMLVTAISMVWHFSTLVNLTRVVEPGFFGGLALLLGQLLYLPNLSLAALSYLAGSGLTIGNSTLLSPWIHRIDELPAIPILGALPDGISNFTYAISILFIIGGIAIGVGVAKFGIRTYSESEELKRFVGSFYLAILLLILTGANLANGQLLSPNLQGVGPIWWALPLVIVANLAIGSLTYLYLESRHGKNS